MAGYKYEWKCPNCGTELQLKMRVTQTKRKCPHCGKFITPAEIDRQTAANKQAKLIANIIIVGIILGLGFFCCKCGRQTPNSESSTSNQAANTTQSSISAVNSVPITISNQNEQSNAVDLSTPENAVQAHFKALKNRDVETYMKTLSQKYLKVYENLGQKVQPWEYKEQKVKKHAQVVIQEMFNDWNLSYIDKPAVFDSSTLLLLEEKVNGNRATIKAIVRSSERTIHLIKEEKGWKLDDFPIGNS